MMETVDEVNQYIEKQHPLHLMGVNADKINELQKNKKLKKIINECELINADGMSVVWASRKLGKPLKERVAGIDLMLELLELSRKKGYSIYLLGAKQEVLEQTVKVIQRKYEGIHIAGYHNGYFQTDEWGDIAQEVENSSADIVFVGISSPLKEYLVEYLLQKCGKGVFMGVGGSFDVISGKIPRAPLWMQKMGLEWLFRVKQEPKRLWKRYLVGNIKFIYYVYREKYRR